MLPLSIFNNGFKEYIDNKRFSDVKLVYADHVYDTHRIILAYSSEFFKRLLCSEFKEATQAKIELRQPDPYNVFPLVLSFMYDGRIWLSPDNVVPLLSMADHYLIHALQSLCNKYLDTNLNRENVVSIMRTAISFHFDAIIDKCVGILAKNFPFICEQQQQPSQDDINSNNSNINNLNVPTIITTNSSSSSSSTSMYSTSNQSNSISPSSSPSKSSSNNSINQSTTCLDCNLTFLPTTIFITLLKHPYLVVKNEFTLYQIVINFIKYHNSSEGNGLDTKDINELMSQIRYIWMTYDQLMEISSNPLVPRDILIETFMERLKKYESPDSKDNNNTLNNNNNNDYIISHSRFLPRPPQSILFEYNHDFDNKGILYWLATNGNKDKWINPHSTSKIKITSSSIDKGTQQDIVELAPFEFWTKDVPASWVTIDFGSNRSVIPMYYTIRHGLSFKSDSLRTWDFQGSMNGEQWTVLKRHTNDLSLNLKYATHTWQITGITTAYRYFRILQTGKNSNNRNFLVIGGIELYGELLQR